MDPEKLQQMMQQAQSMQQRMQDSLAQEQVEGQAGGGMVRLTMNGAYEVVALKIDPAVVDKDDVSMLEDLVRAALNDATARVEEVRLNQARNMAGQMGIPGLF